MHTTTHTPTTDGIMTLQIDAAERLRIAGTELRIARLGVAIGTFASSLQDGLRLTRAERALVAARLAFDAAQDIACPEADRS